MIVDADTIAAPDSVLDAAQDAVAAQSEDAPASSAETMAVEVDEPPAAPPPAIHNSPIPQAVDLPPPSPPGTTIPSSVSAGHDAPEAAEERELEAIKTTEAASSPAADTQEAVADEVSTAIPPHSPPAVDQSIEPGLEAVPEGQEPAVDLAGTEAVPSDPPVTIAEQEASPPADENVTAPPVPSVPSPLPSAATVHSPPPEIENPPVTEGLAPPPPAQQPATPSIAAAPRYDDEIMSGDEDAEGSIVEESDTEDSPAIVRL